MTASALVGLFAATLIFAITPGPGTLAVISRGLSRGFGPSFVLGIGLTLGDMIYLWAAMLSLGFIADHAGDLFQWVRWLGGAYLVWIGIQTFRSPPAIMGDGQRIGSGWIKSLIAGCAISCTNPKVMLFYLGFLPVFLDMAALTLADMLWVSLVIEVALLIVLFGISAGAHRLRPLLARGRFGVWINRVAGTTMGGVGVVVAST
ncbi:hypothetical protein GH975_04720 [Litorivicinus lipolyticus]|uniref:LysE family translocator n=1 Tax=Litorivicinus lipolyticus TaxID=418701 RepID=A0A5Q2QD52_9GAMM|nr:LysE family translocator [Litorivicinus lipolyticus]QGG79917.1 hypothetical protein GH975_04720 [Litorivicinus lipolyticus]